MDKFQVKNYTICNPGNKDHLPIRELQQTNQLSSDQPLLWSIAYDVYKLLVCLCIIFIYVNITVTEVAVWSTQGIRIEQKQSLINPNPTWNTQEITRKQHIKQPRKPTTTWQWTEETRGLNTQTINRTKNMWGTNEETMETNNRTELRQPGKGREWENENQNRTRM